MRLSSAVALAVMATAPAIASASAFSIDFENVWSYGVDVNGYYGGGTASDGTSGANLGVTFVNVSGLSNEPGFTYYQNAPTPLGTGYAHTFAVGDAAFINVASGVGNALTFAYSSPSGVVGAIKAWSGVNGTGTLLGTFDLTANVATDYDRWSVGTLSFAGVARSFDLTASANSVLFDNIASVPEPGTVLMLLVGGTALVAARGRRRRA